MGMKKKEGSKGMKKKEGSKAIGQNRLLVSTGCKLYPKKDYPAIMEVWTQEMDWRNSWGSRRTSTGKSGANIQLFVT